MNREELRTMGSDLVVDAIEMCNTEGHCGLTFLGGVFEASLLNLYAAFLHHGDVGTVCEAKAKFHEFVDIYYNQVIAGHEEESWEE